MEWPHHIIGSGLRPALLFVGAGLNSRHLSPLASVFPDYTFYVFDLWPDRLDSPEGLRNLTDHFLLPFVHQMTHRPVLVGFSMGARVALTLAAACPTCCGEIWLIAPEGFRPHLWWHLANRTWIGQGLFGWWCRHEKWAMRLLATGERWGLAERGISRAGLEALLPKLPLIWQAYDRLDPTRALRIPDLAVRIWYGLQDRWCGDDTLTEARRCWPSARLTALPGGHFQAWTQWLRLMRNDIG